MCYPCQNAVNNIRNLRNCIILSRDANAAHVIADIFTAMKESSSLPVCRISEVDGCLPASSYISNRNLMYELAGDFT